MFGQDLRIASTGKRKKQGNTMIKYNIHLVTLVVAAATYGCGGTQTDPTTSNVVPSVESSVRPALTLDRLQEDTFRYFWETTDSATGLAPDRFPTNSPASIAAVGFALTSYPVGVARGLISRAQARSRTLTTLRFLANLPMGSAASGTAGYHGFFYHFIGMNDGLRFVEWDVELSTVDTAILMAGVLFVQSYFDEDNADEVEIRYLAKGLYERVNWQWSQNSYPLISLGWYPARGFITYDWVGYNEAMLVYILALGSPTFPVEKDAWDAWTDHYEDDWGGREGFEHLTFAPMFGHQYSHAWIDFREIRDEYMSEKNSDYFINSTKAAYAQRQYAIANPGRWEAYGENIWGLTASDGPGNFVKLYRGSLREFRGYSARGVAVNHSFDDGTLAPTALGGSLPFAPEIIVPALGEIYERYGEHLYAEYGFLDAFNPSFRFNETPQSGVIIDGLGWIGTDYIGIDQGAILLMAENYRTELIWDYMKMNTYIQSGLRKAGFVGGWLGDLE